ncbi:MAG: response regulator [Nanoarchaeota archaeon]
MKLERILIADDREENRKAAKEVFVNADIVGSEAEAISKLEESKDEEYDLVITDMKMEEKYSGLRVVKTALENGAIPYVLSHTGPSHTGVSIELRPYGKGIYDYSLGKADPAVWKEAKSQIESAEDVHKWYQEVLVKAKSMKANLDFLTNDENLIFAMYNTQEIS